MVDHIIHVTAKLPDKQIIRLYHEVQSAFGDVSASFRYGSISIPAEEAETLLSKSSRYSISEATLNFSRSSLQVNVRRGASSLGPDGTNINNRTPSPYFDEIIVIPGKGDRAATLVECIKLEEIIARFATISVPKSVEKGADGAIDLLQAQIAGLSSLYDKMIEETISSRSELEGEYAAKRVQLAELDEERNRQHNERAKRAQEQLEELRRELEESRKAIDDREPMHVRRQLRKDISTEIQSRVASDLHPKRTSWTGHGVFIFSVICACIAAAISYYSYVGFVELIGSEPADAPPTLLVVALGARGIISSIAAIGFLIYALTWIRSSYVRDVQTSNELQRYALDINRASWIIETIMEMTTKEGRDLPDKWIEGACHGLFRGHDGDHREVTPLEAWGALLNVSGSAEYGPNGPRVTFSKRGTRKLAKSVEE
jgi:hypothetical protein